MSTILAPGARLRSQAKHVFFVVFGLVTASVTYMKNARILDPSSGTAQHFAPVEWYLVAHAFFRATAMLLGVVQFSNRLRARYLKLHRVQAYGYVVTVCIYVPL